MLPAVDYEFLTQYVAERSGTALGPRKQFLLQARLVPLAQSCGLGSLHDLVRELRQTAASPLGDAVVDLLSATDQAFYRDPATFDDLRERVLPALINARQAVRRLRLWTAASGSGQEAYSLAILLQEHFPELHGWSVELVATDSSQTAIQRAVDGRYSQTEVQLGLPIRELLRWFEPADGAWQVRDELRRRIRFQSLSLTEPWPAWGRFDVILCRQIVGQWLPSERRAVLEQFAHALQPDGCLCLGAQDSLSGNTTQWDRRLDCQSAAYTPSTLAAGRLRVTA